MQSTMKIGGKKSEQQPGAKLTTVVFFCFHVYCYSHCQRRI